MTRIIIASAAEESRTKVSRLLASSGFSVFRLCESESELRRAISESQDGLVVLLGSLPGCRADELQWDYRNGLHILQIARPSVLAECENPEVFRLALPTSSQAIVGAVQMLEQLHQMQLPRRSAADKDIVDQAKRLLMQRDGLTEPEAHRALQQYAMNHGMKMADYAAQIIK